VDGTLVSINEVALHQTQLGPTTLIDDCLLTAKPSGYVIDHMSSLKSERVDKSSTSLSDWG